MQLTIRTLSKGNFTVEVQLSDTVVRVKEIIDEEGFDFLLQGFNHFRTTMSIIPNTTIRNGRYLK